MQQLSMVYQGKAMRVRHRVENKMEGKEKKQSVPQSLSHGITSDFGFGFFFCFCFFFFNFNFEMLPVVPGGGLRLRMTHWRQGMGVCIH